MTQRHEKDEQAGRVVRDWAWSALGMVLGASAGIAASIAALPPVACLALPLLAVLGLRATPWFVPFAAVLSFFLAGSRDLFPAAHNFFPDPAQAWSANAGLLVICASVAAIWSFGARTADRVGLAPAIGLGAVAVLTLLPPLGAFAGMHPVHAFGYLWPGGGWAAVIVLSVGSVGVAGWLARKRAWLPPAAVLALLAAVPFSATEPDPARGNDRYRSVNTAWPEQQLSIEQRIDRISKLGRVVRALAPLDVSWIVFPEGTVHAAPGSDYLLGLEARSGSPRPTVWVGMSQGQSGDVAHSRIRIFRPDGSQQDVRARQPMPLSLWRPWDSTAPPSSWLTPAQVTSPVGPAYVSFCFEDILPGVFLLSAAREGRPNIIVSVANNAFLSSNGAVQAQAWRIENMSRLFAVPLLRAVNVPGEGNQETGRRAGATAAASP